MQSGQGNQADEDSSWPLRAIGTLQSPFQEKFGIPRQPGLTQIKSTLQLDPDLVTPESLAGIETQSHLWLVFGFHGITPPRRAQTVRPPRLGGNARIGVFATRSPFRPNGLGLSLVQLAQVHAQELTLVLCGADLLDQTPVFDIKPYLPYCDQVDEAKSWAQKPPEPVPVTPGPALAAHEPNPQTEGLWPHLVDYLRWDPRPPYRPIPDPKIYRQRFANHEITFERDVQGVIVHSITPKESPTP